MYCNIYKKIRNILKMPFFGFLTEEDLKPLATKEDLKILANKDDLKPFVSEGIVAKVTGDLKKDLEKNSSDLKKDLEKNSSLLESLNEKGECTKIINGVHICDEPLYESVKSPFELTYKDIFQGSDFCVGIKSVYDLVPPKYRELVSAKYTSGLDSDLPDNYVCIEGGKARNYLDTIVDTKIVDYMSKHGEKFPFHKTNPEYVMSGRCYSKCSKYTCDEIKNGAVAKDREKERNHCVEKYKKQFDEKQNSRTSKILSSQLDQERDKYVRYNCQLNMKSISKHEDKVEECFGCDTSKKCNLNNL